MAPPPVLFQAAQGCTDDPPEGWSDRATTDLQPVRSDRQSVSSLPRNYNLSPPDRVALCLAARRKVCLREAGTGLRRYGQPSDVANLAAFLASPRAGQIQGADLFIDGQDHPLT
jgi:NAD(P)-dependent dehydrogenase (short-subunit alcohol dehydrogenase family)